MTLDNLRRLKAQGRPFDWRTYDGLDHQLSPAVREDISGWLRGR